MSNFSPVPSVLALGNFDGLHRGHAAVLDAALDVARRRGLRPTVLLFDRHPKAVLDGRCPPMLMTEEDKHLALAALGFTPEIVSFEALRTLPPQAFLEKLQTELGAKAICCGKNYRFGAKAAGTVETLRQCCPALGVEVCVVEDALYEDAPVSSTRIRAALEGGDLAAANAMLGAPFHYCLPVVSGDRRGRRLGFPTINQFFPPDFVRLHAGVYASKVQLKDVWYPAVTNVGVRPTIGTDSFRSETCILGFSGDLYGQRVAVHLLRYLREERKCRDLKELQALIAADVTAAKTVFEEDVV